MDFPTINRTETLSRVCDNGICHCDWRLTLQDCIEMRLLSSTILIADICPDFISRAFMFEFPWQFGYGAFALYLIGIAQTLADSHKVIANNWLPSPRLVDIIGCTIFLAPFIINNVMSLAAGILAQKDLKLAKVFTRLLYIFWFIHCFCLAVSVVFSGFRLTRILKNHLNKFNTTGPRYVSVKTGIFKIRAVMSIIGVCLIMFAVFLLMFGILREKIIVNLLGSIILGAFWNFLGVVTTLGVELAIIFNPKIDDNTSFGLKANNNNPSTSEKISDNEIVGQYVTYSNITTSQEYSPSNNKHQDISNNSTFDELKLQQLQYQGVFQKYSQLQTCHNELKPNYVNNSISLAHSDARQMKVSADSAPLQVDEYHPGLKKFNNNEKITFPSHSPQLFAHLEEENILDDGEHSQMNLVEYMTKS
ncbi:uncharacterized protein BX663DRAFT_537063 [Cokeromyces recurvatus]|uniref:uncharacterized protein n=1 Tax=Cokeromyces recurvatus TaxID=90255 RepID=UPI0022207AEA|nr:uncharacterized protein BX663DRAFT_537063 [Cokeromyces recurvatus]KAI7901306.1 hypothetical protein BX663DRAFT_537063 [Cokeromyces recurvatus]